jgi:serine/threonine-protein kinase
VFDSSRSGARNIWWQPSDGTGTAERLTTSPNLQIPTDVTPDGRTLIFTEEAPETVADLMQLPLEGLHQPSVLLQTKFNERNGVVSPDGRWLAYQSDASGRYEIYVRPYPNVSSGQWEVSTAGGTRPLWARSGKELYFAAPDGTVMSAIVDAGSTWNAHAPQKLFAGPYYFASGSPQRTFDVAPDGRFLMIKTPDRDSVPAPQLVVIQHADQELAGIK